MDTHPVLYWLTPNGLHRWKVVGSETEYDFTGITSDGLTWLEICLRDALLNAAIERERQLRRDLPF